MISADVWRVRRKLEHAQGREDIDLIGPDLDPASDLRGTRLRNILFDENSSFRGAHVEGVDFELSRTITPRAFASMIADEKIKLPYGVSRPASWH